MNEDRPGTPLPAQPAAISAGGKQLAAGVLIGAAGFEAFLFLADALFNHGELTELGTVQRFFNITREDGLASWFAVTQTWMVGLTAALIYLVLRTQPGARLRAFGWLFIALFLFYMSMDDGAKFHERVGTAVKSMLASDDGAPGALAFFPSYTWQVVFLPVFGAFGLFLLVFLHRELADRWSRVLVVAGIGLLVLAVVLDFFEGADVYHPLNLLGHIEERFEFERDTIRHFSKAIEETLEMLAMTLLWCAFLRHLPTVAPALSLRFT